jgi:hypothetical protein
MVDKNMVPKIPTLLMLDIMRHESLSAAEQGLQILER